MSTEDKAIAKLDQAITRLEAALTRLSNGTDGEALQELEGENRRLSTALDSAKKDHKDLEGRVIDVSGRLDGVIGELKSVLGS
ncbi:MAG: DUF4164 family protein [Alphaproteobacteria bacterium]|jgi:hypothetical protein|nr:DUF4164 family protein [Rhodospirillaceae bacterium]MDG2479505.1 DUF4164 family protein [Alphaproteobacteria bacterium]MBT6206302.1 DUF4164 family protein [Rhodospirillaceae bacterium]MBT6508959.1 DUF4164 family protein [Rhodospirillaceae bacterium]MBT7612626.1 DUF4164 family protein [Rhodospirillaceae bacterium]